MPLNGSRLTAPANGKIPTPKIPKDHEREKHTKTRSDVDLDGFNEEKKPPEMGKWEIVRSAE
jgi:hypothetical protein